MQKWAYNLGFSINSTFVISHFINLLHKLNICLLYMATNPSPLSPAPFLMTMSCHSTVQITENCAPSIPHLTLQ